jgi:glucosyl-dolichyl phosphate glucuronosyltransferase
MRVDVVIPTHNRATMLARSLTSLLSAEAPNDLLVDVTVVDNRSTDETPAVVESFVARFAGRLHYLYEAAPGRSNALNAGIAATSGDLVAMIDDDEEVECGWLRCIERCFQDPAIDFIGGPYVPRWGAERPTWLGTGYRAAVGWVDGGSEVRQFGPGFDGILMGGNAVIKRSVLSRVGPYATDLGRTERHLLSCEDEDMCGRLLASGARGFYRPDLVIYHFVPPDRLQKRYFRRWCFWRGVSMGVLDRRQPTRVTYFLGIPRYLIGSAVRGIGDTLRNLIRQREPSRSFSNELAWWDLAGFIYGKHWYRTG